MLLFTKPLEKQLIIVQKYQRGLLGQPLSNTCSFNFNLLSTF